MTKTIPTKRVYTPEKAGRTFISLLSLGMSKQLAHAYYRNNNVEAEYCGKQRGFYIRNSDKISNNRRTISFSSIFKASKSLW